MDELQLKSRFSRNTFLVIACGKAKIWDKQPHFREVPAKDAYTGGLFRLCRRYAETFYPNRWLILSAKYGLILPEKPIENYNLSFNSGTPITVSRLKKQCQRHFTKAKKIICLAGKDYLLILKSAMQKGVHIDCPVAHMGLYARMAWLKEKVSNSSSSYVK